MARIVFDLDGTLIDSALDLHHIANAILTEEGLAPITVAQARGFIGNGARVFVARLCGVRSIPEAELDRIFEKFMQRYQGAVHLTVPYPGVKHALQQLTRAGHHLGICTNKPMAPCMAVLRHLELDGHFQTVRAGDSLPVHKPEPDPLNAAFADLPDGPEIYVGDSEVDVETAQRAMVPFLLFTEGYRKKPVAMLPHTGTFSNYDALPGLVRQLLAEDRAPAGAGDMRGSRSA